jgi:activating signal cointegrator complex subunit 2
LLLAEKLAVSSPGLDIQTLLDLSIVYVRSHPIRLKAVFSTAIATNPSIISAEITAAFISLLSPSHSSQGLYSLRKVTHCLLSLLRASPPPLTRLFSSDKQFILALARAYDEGLGAIARSYGGLRGHLVEDTWIAEGEVGVDEWERVWVETKVELMDSFHLLLGGMVEDLASAGGELGREAEQIFDVIFAMLELSSGSNSSHSLPNSSDPATPFLNRPLLADYQHSYDLSHTMSSALRHAATEIEKDARLDLLESTLSSFEISSDGSKDPGALKILLRSSGVLPGIDNTGRGPCRHMNTNPSPYPDNKGNRQNKGKGKASPQNQDADPDPDLELKTTQVLSILPDHDPSYVRALLVRHGTGAGEDVERVVEMLLEGTAPPKEELVVECVGGRMRDGSEEAKELEYVYTRGRKNVFDDDVMDLSNVRIGKKRFVFYFSLTQFSCPLLPLSKTDYEAHD